MWRTHEVRGEQCDSSHKNNLDRSDNRALPIDSHLERGGGVRLGVKDVVAGAAQRLVPGSRVQRIAGEQLLLSKRKAEVVARTQDQRLCLLTKLFVWLT
jgi:hypothetical protein